MKNNKNSTHLPLYGVGPVIIFGQFIFTASAIIFENIGIMNMI